jgi:hypothetical protein
MLKTCKVKFGKIEEAGRRKGTSRRGFWPWFCKRRGIPAAAANAKLRGEFGAPNLPGGLAGNYWVFREPALVVN